MKNEKITASGARNLNVCFADTVTKPFVAQVFDIETARQDSLSEQDESAKRVTASGIVDVVVVLTELMFLLTDFAATRTPSAVAPWSVLLKSRSRERSSNKKIRNSSSGNTKANSTAAAPTSFLCPRVRASHNRIMASC
jgi:hypothetical protein